MRVPPERGWGRRNRSRRRGGRGQGGVPGGGGTGRGKGGGGPGRGGGAEHSPNPEFSLREFLMVFVVMPAVVMAVWMLPGMFSTR
jgi:hypothetical protein